MFGSFFFFLARLCFFVLFGYLLCRPAGAQLVLVFIDCDLAPPARAPVVTCYWKAKQTRRLTYKPELYLYQWPESPSHTNATRDRLLIERFLQQAEESQSGEENKITNVIREFRNKARARAHSRERARWIVVRLDSSRAARFSSETNSIPTGPEQQQQQPS